MAERMKLNPNLVHKKTSSSCLFKDNYYFSKLHDEPCDYFSKICQSEAKCYAIDMKLTFYSRVNKSNIHKKDFAREKRGILELGNGQLTNW